MTAAEFTYNNARQASTGMSPFFLVTGQNPTVPVALFQPGIEETNVQSTKEFVGNMADLIKRATENLVKAQKKQVKFADEHRREVTFEVGDQVLLDARNLSSDIESRRPSKKLQSRYEGPFKILEKTSSVDYKLELPAHWRMHPVIHVSLLKKYQENTEEFPERNILSPLPEQIDEHEEYEVEQILDRRTKYKKPEYLVKWKGYELHDATWEPLENLKNAQEAIKEFEKDQE